MKKIANVLIALFIPTLSFCQARIIFNGANIILAQNAKLVIQNPAANAVTVQTTGGIGSESAGNEVIWSIGTNAESYNLPFIANGNKIPVSFSTSGASGLGALTLSTYAGPDWKNSNYLPPSVTNVDRDGIDNSNHVIDRFWQIHPSGYTTNPSLNNLAFAYNENEWNETGNNIIEASLVAQSWNSTSGAWTNPGGTDNASANIVTVPLITGNNLNNWWTLVDETYALPLQLLNFSAEKQNTNVLLKWLVASQENVNYYEIQRSLNGVDFSIRGKENASLNAIENYSFIDTVLISNVHAIYYRLRMVDMDGTFSFSPVRSINYSENQNNLFQLFPNPATEFVLIRSGAINEGNYKLSVTDAQGKIIIQKEVSLSPNADYKLNRETLMAAGTYYISITGKNSKQVLSVIFQ